jgi:Flp pilus assembly protein CpaB
MRNIYFFLAAVLAFGVAWYYWTQVSDRTATVTKLRIVAEDGLVIREGTAIDQAFVDRYVVSQPVPMAIAAEFGWALDDSPVTRINLVGRTLGRELHGGAFLQREDFFVTQEDDFARRIAPGNRAFSIPVQADRAVEGFVLPGARVDVIGVFEESENVFVPERLLENAVVMAVDQFDSVGAYEAEDREGFNTVTLQAPAAQAETFLARMQEMTGDLSLVLRNPCENAEDCAAPAAEAPAETSAETPAETPSETPADPAANPDDPATEPAE